MDHILLVSRRNKDGALLAVPKVTFRGLGGYFAGPVVSVIEAAAPAEEVGLRITELLSLCRDTGAHVKDLRAYIEKNRDAGSRLAMKEYGFDPEWPPSKLIKRFTSAWVTHRDGQKSWKLHGLGYNASLRALETQEPPEVVPFRDGPQGLGNALLELLAPGSKRATARPARRS